MARFLLAAACALSCVAAAAQPASAPLGPRIGATLDIQEQVYFGLFPGLDAPPYGLRRDRDSVRVVSDGQAVMALSFLHAGQLARYVDTFEDYPTVPANPNWEASAAFVSFVDARVKVPRMTPSEQVRAVTPEGTYTGYVLYTTDSLMVMAPEVRPRDPALTGAYVLPRASVESLERTARYRWQRWGPLLGTGIGAVLGVALSGSSEPVPGLALGGALGHAAGTLPSQLDGSGLVGQTRTPAEAAFFDSRRPPELPPPSIAAELASRPRPQPGPRPRAPRAHEWVSVGVHGIVGYDEADRSALPGRELIRGRQGQPARFQPSVVGRTLESPSVPFRVDVAVRPLKWVRLGVYIGGTTTGDSLFANEGTEQILRRYGSLRPYAEAVLPVLRLGRQRVELSAGGGREGYRVRSVQVAPALVDNRRVLLATQEAEDMGTAWFAHVGVEAYSSSRTSLFVRHGWHALPTLQVPAFTSLALQDNGTVLREVDAHEVPFSYREVTVGSRIHF